MACIGALDAQSSFPASNSNNDPSHVFVSRRRVRSVVKHSSANQKGPRFDSGPGLIPGSWIIMFHASYLEWSTTFLRLWVYRISVSYAQKDPRFLFKKKRGNNQKKNLPIKNNYYPYISKFKKSPCHL